MRYSFLKLLSHVRKYCTDNICSDLIGRKLLCPLDLCKQDIHSIFWTASELKNLASADDEYCIQSVLSKQMLFLLDQFVMHSQMSALNAIKILQARMHMVFAKPDWEECKYFQDVGKMVSNEYDLLLLYCTNHSRAETIAKGAKIPVVSVQSYTYMIMRGLSDLFTIYEHFGYLENLNISWLGPVTPLINTFLEITPRLGIKLRYMCTCRHGKVSPSSLHHAKTMLGPCFKQNVKECTCMEEALADADVVVVSMINDSSDPPIKLTSKSCSKFAHKAYQVLHTMPRGELEIDEELFDSKRNLVWMSLANERWIYAALMVLMTVEFKHITPKPHLHKVNVANKEKDESEN